MPTVARSLSTAPFKDSYQKELLRFLDAHQSPKAIYWEREAIAPVNLIVGHSVLKDHGVNHSYLIDPQHTSQCPPDVKTIFFVLHSNLKILDIVRNFLKSEFSPRAPTSETSKREYCIIAIPTFSVVCKAFLQETQVYNRLSGVYELPLTLLPLDSDLLSMEDPDSFASFSLHENEVSLFNLAKGLMKFQAVYGLFPRIRSKGAKAKRVVAMLAQMRQEAAATANLDVSTDAPTVQPLESPGQADLLIIIDRSVDILTPCLSQLTYEGLINEVFPVKYGSVKIPLPGSENNPKSVVFNSVDQLFSDIRNQNFTNVASILSKRTKELSAIINETKSSKELNKLRQVVGQLPELRQLHASASVHMSIAESVQDYATSDDFMSSFRTQQGFLSGHELDKVHPYIEKRILEMAPIEEVLRLICVQSLCSGGLKPRLLEFYAREITQMYGPEHMMTLDNLKRLGLLEESSRLAVVSQPSNTSAFFNDGNGAVRHTIAAISTAYSSSLRRSLRLQVTSDGTNQQSPHQEQSLDGAFAQIFGGSVPISVRLVQAMALGWPTRSLLAPTSGVGGGGGAFLSSAANTALLAGRRLVSNAAAVNTSSGGYVMSLLPAVELDETQTPGEVLTASKADGFVGGMKPTTSNVSVKPDNATKTVVIAFVGGVTHSELAALRKVAASEEGQVDFIFATTGLLTWKSLMRSLLETIPVAEIED
uniref:Sec1 family domain-containing protein 1 n=2 Tax=Mesocestoides corti TaxID=53468 RepID=A0A5K3EUS8_MESCO